MNRYLIFTCVACATFFACEKRSVTMASSSLNGKWVLEPGTNAMNDTLIFYQQGVENMFFDKSVYFLTNAAAWTTDNSFKYTYKLGEAAGDSLETRSLTSTSTQTWVTVYFKPLSATEIEIGNFRYGGLDTTTKFIFRKVE